MVYGSFYLYEKSKGTRCLLYFTCDKGREVHYLINCKNGYYRIQNLHFPMPGDETFGSFHTETLLDGELVWDDIDAGKKLLRYYVVDCLAMDSQLLVSKSLGKRIGVWNPIFAPSLRH